MEIRKFWGKAIDVPEEWSVVRVNPFGIIVKWREKYGENREEKCIGLWENKDKYRLTYKDSKFIELQKSNLNSIEAIDNDEKNTEGHKG
jgi:hypothetical protein